MTDDRPTRADYPWHRPFPTRWHDNDVFGHLNNTIYYAAMDTTVTAWLLGRDDVAGSDSATVPQGYGLTAADGDPAVVVSSSCRYYESGAFPETLEVGLRADRVGTTSIAWGLGIFRRSDQALLAVGTFVHVFVDRTTRRPIPVPAPIRARVHRELEAGA